MTITAKSFEKARKKLIAELNLKIGMLSDAWLWQEITDQEYLIQKQQLQKRIKNLC